MIECTREDEILEALASEAALDAWSDDLRAHAEACEVCRDIVAVARPLLQEHQATIQGAQPPSSGVVWWRAQMRARQEAARAATRPITLFQAAGAAAGVVGFVMLLGAVAPIVSGWFGGLTVFSGLGDVFRLPEIELASLKPTTTVGLVLAGACAICVLLGPLAVYFVLSDE